VVLDRFEVLGSELPDRDEPFLVITMGVVERELDEPIGVRSRLS
jgi:hypothetical protein